LVVSYYSCCDSEAGSSIASRREAGADVAHFLPTPLRLRLQARGVARVALSTRHQVVGEERAEIWQAVPHGKSRGDARIAMENKGGAASPPGRGEAREMRRLELFRVAKKWLGDGTRQGARGSERRRRRRAGREACGEARDRRMAARRRRRVFGFARFHEVSGPHRSGQDPNRSESNG